MGVELFCDLISANIGWNKLYRAMYFVCGVFFFCTLFHFSSFMKREGGWSSEDAPGTIHTEYSGVVDRKQTARCYVRDNVLSVGHFPKIKPLRTKQHPDALAPSGFVFG